MMKEQLKEKTKESLASVLPITVIVFLLSATVVPMETGTLLLGPCCSSSAWASFSLAPNWQ